MRNYGNIIHYLVSCVIVLIVIWLDQGSKELVSQYLSNEPLVQVSEYLNLVSIWNYGVSFGMFSNANVDKWVFIGVSSVISMALLIDMMKADLVQKISYSMIVGGAIANILDRVKYGAVFDFIDFHYQEWHYPVFNGADIFIVLGVLFWLVSFKKR